ncbi:hypothetical protein D3C81_1782010 [compost metagenome]
MACFLIVLKNNDLSILSSKLDYATDIRMKLLYSHGNRIDFLYKLRSDVRSKRAAAGARRKDANLLGVNLRKSVPNGN